MPQTNDQGETPGAWLFLKDGRKGAITDVISAARANWAFRLLRSADDNRKRLDKIPADGDMHAVVEDAKTNRRSY